MTNTTKQQFAEAYRLARLESLWMDQRYRADARGDKFMRHEASIRLNQMREDWLAIPLHIRESAELCFSEANRCANYEKFTWIHKHSRRIAICRETPTAPFNEYRRLVWKFERAQSSIINQEMPF